jgi:hypothetical protein
VITAAAGLAAGGRFSAFDLSLGPHLEGGVALATGRESTGAGRDVERAILLAGLRARVTVDLDGALAITFAADVTTTLRGLDLRAEDEPVLGVAGLSAGAIAGVLYRL